MKGLASSVQSGVEFHNTVGRCSVLNFCQASFDCHHLIRQLAAIATSLTSLLAVMFTVIQEDILAIVGAGTLQIEFENHCGIGKFDDVHAEGGIITAPHRAGMQSLIDKTSAGLEVELTIYMVDMKLLSCRCLVQSRR